MVGGFRAKPPQAVKIRGTLMLEDDYTYVLRKALMGNQCPPEEAAAMAGISDQDFHSFASGRFRAETARKLANVLGLYPDAFANHQDYHPFPVQLAGLHRLDLPFAGEQVNAWLLLKDDFAVLFDCGFEARDLFKAMSAIIGDRSPNQVFVTHTHRDHVGALEKLVAAGVPVHAADVPGTIRMAPNSSVTWGPLAIHACDLSGHANPALGFFVDGLDAPVLVTGDAVFAGSIGGCSSREAYQLALRRIREVTENLPDSTILLPGHGPATTLGEERSNNPFFLP